MTSRKTLPRLAAAALAAAALSAPAAHARPADNDPATAIQAEPAVTTHARADDGGINWTEAGFAAAAVVAFAGAFGFVIRPRASRAST
jgi:hypothetical protein